MKRCIQCNQSLPNSEYWPKAAASDGLQPRCKQCNRDVVREWSRAARAEGRLKPSTLTTEQKLFYAARRRAKRDGLPFSINLDDIQIPEYCPALGLKLIAGSKKGPLPMAPSLDRIIPALGYVPGNIQVISHKANSMKRDATREELVRFAKWVLGGGGGDE